MHVCMMMLKYREYMVRLDPQCWSLRVTMPFSKDYGFQMYLYHGFYQVPRVINRFQTLSSYGNTSDPILFARKSRLSVVSRIN